jgi:glucokinase
MKQITYTVGIDLGGTKLASALVNSRGEIIAFKKESILDLKKHSPLKSQTEIVNLMADHIDQYKKRYPLFLKAQNFKGVGLASAGPLNVLRGEIINPANFPGWKIVPIKKKLEDALRNRRIKSTVSFQNDAIAASLAEGWTGGAVGLKSFSVVTMGTGIGTGVILNGQPCQTLGMGSEFGHLILQNDQITSPETLSQNTAEGIASGTAILRRAKLMGFRGETVEELVAEIENGNTRFIKLFDDAADALAALCYNLSIGFNLQKILLSGGLIKVRHLYLSRLKKRHSLLTKKFNPAFTCQIVVAKHLNQAGVIGAAYLPYIDHKGQI